MYDDTPHNDPRQRHKPTKEQAGLALGIAALATVALLAAGCGGGSKTPSIASLGTTTSNNASSSASPSSSAGGAFPIGASMSIDVGTGASGVKYSACMRAHGVPNYPDPDAQGTITITVSASLNPSSPVFQQAQADCRHLIPAGSEAGQTLSSAQRQQMQERALAFAACMRAHGVPDYPDPTFSNGGVTEKSGGDGLSPNSPTFQAAQKSCQAQRTQSP
jgi:hypothetical protein